MNQLKPLLAVFCGASLLLLGCAHHGQGSQTMAQLNAKHCASNPYLQRFDCSIDRVQSAAMDGDADAQYALGYMYYYGVGTVSDPETGELWIRKAAAQNQPLAKRAEALLHPDLAPVNPVEAMPAGVKVAHSSVPHFSKRLVRRAAVAPLKDPRLLPSAKPITAPMLAHRTGVRALTASPSAVSDNHYTMQLIATPHRADAQAFLRAHRLAKKTFLYASKGHGGRWYRVVYGDYPTAKAAHQAVLHLPKNLRRLHPWVKSYRRVHHEMSDPGPILTDTSR